MMIQPNTKCFVNIPKISVSHESSSVPKNNPRGVGTHSFDYDDDEHRQLPHVIKFSGGRSSAMLLFTLLENKFLRKERGDVIVFNNTSAEHPATYDFVKRCNAEAEKYDIPFFWIEFQTYEDAVRGEWARLPTYKLVNSTIFDPIANPNGYHCRGEVFEELLSWKRFLPNKFERVCTASMKIFTTRELLKDWLSLKPHLKRLGHFYDGPMSDDETVVRTHLKNGGATPREVLLRKIKFVRSRSTYRPKQMFADFTSVSLDYLASGGTAYGFYKPNSDAYVSFIGFRGDEPVRVARMQRRNYGGNGTSPANNPHVVAQQDEYVYAPLAGMNIDQKKVQEFWQSQDWGDLHLPYETNFSNCVFCFLKGITTLKKLSDEQTEVEKELPKRLRSVKGTPSSLDWWIDVEKKYSRDLKEENREIRSETGGPSNHTIGFWGMNSDVSFAKLAQVKSVSEFQNVPAYAELPCDCTD